MKKLMMMAMMAAAATTAFAQDALVKEAKKLSGSGDFDAALEKLAPALTSSETLDKAAAWKQQSDIAWDKFMKIQSKEAENQVTQKKEPYDTLGMYHAAVLAWESALKCDEFDQQPDAKGKVKLKYRTGFQNRFKNHGVALVQAGQTEYQKQNLQEALKAWAMYLDMAQSPIFAEVKDFPKDPFYSDIAYYAAFLAYQEKDYAAAIKYAKIAAQDPEKANDANEVLLFAKKENCKTAADTLAFVNEIKELHKANPENERYFNMLVDHYSRANDNAAMQAFAQEEVENNPQNRTAWFMLGYSYMAQEKYGEAVDKFVKSTEIDPNFVEGYFNAGVCLNNKARQLQDELADKKTNTITPESRNPIWRKPKNWILFERRLTGLILCGRSTMLCRWKLRPTRWNN